MIESCILSVSLIIDLLKITSYFVGIIVAIWGLIIWKDQTKWKKKFELASNYLPLVYEFVNKIQVVRNPLHHTLVMNSKYKYINSDAGFILTSLDVFKERIYKLDEYYRGFQLENFKLIALFGSKANKLKNDIENMMFDIIHAESRARDIAIISKKLEPEGVDYKRIEKHLKVIQNQGEDDEITKKLQAIVTDAESLFLKYLK